LERKKLSNNDLIKFLIKHLIKHKKRKPKGKLYRQYQQIANVPNEAAQSVAQHTLNEAKLERIKQAENNGFRPIVEPIANNPPLPQIEHHSLPPPLEVVHNVEVPAPQIMEQPIPQIEYHSPLLLGFNDVTEDQMKKEAELEKDNAESTNIKLHRTPPRPLLTSKPRRVKVREPPKPVHHVPVTRQQTRENKRSSSSSSLSKNEENDQAGEGKIEDTIDEKGLSNLEIDAIMKNHKDYLGTISSDQIPTLIPKLNGRKRVGFIMNLDPHTKAGSHWVAVYIDARPEGSHSVEYYDSFARQPSSLFLTDIKKLIEAMKPDTYLKCKVNKIVKQTDNSTNCGYHAIHFLLDRFRNVPFHDCSGYNDAVKGERDIEAFKRRIGIEPFKYLYHGTGIKTSENWVLQGILFDKTYWSEAATQTFLSKHNLHPIKPVHITAKYYRYRLRNPIKGVAYRAKLLNNHICLTYMDG
jgi:hypothetical protein